MSYILTEKENHIGIITVNRPQALNAMNTEVLGELDQALDAMLENDDIGVIILTGSGDRAFIAGADIKSMQSMSQQQALEFGKLGQKLTLKIEKACKPVIAAVNGFALGGGCEISLACHLRIASENAQFAQPEVHLGIIPGWGGTQRLTRVVGKGRALEMIATGEMTSAAEALEIGLVNRVVALDQLLERGKKMAAAILKNSPKAVAQAIRCIHVAQDVTLEEGLNFEAEQFSQLFGSDETDEGLTAFVEKRQPKFWD